MRCLALMDAGDTARFRKLEMEANRILRANYGTVSKRSTEYAFLARLSACLHARMLIGFHRTTHTEGGQRRLARL